MLILMLLINTSSPPQSFGAKDVTDLNWVQLLNAYSCTECGRCTSNCPANQTGKLLSPRKNFNGYKGQDNRIFKK